MVNLVARMQKKVLVSNAAGILVFHSHFEALQFLHGLMGKMELSMVTELKLLVEEGTRTIRFGHPSSDSFVRRGACPPVGVAGVLACDV